MAMAMLVLVSLVAFAALMGCGSSGSRGRYFAYVQYEPVTASAPGVARHQAHAGAKQHAVTAAARPSSAPGKFAAITFTGGTPVAGDQDIYFYDTHTNTPALVNTALYVDSIQISNDDRKFVASVLTYVTGQSGTSYYQLWVGDRTLHSITQITTDLNDHFGASFSADGRMIAYLD